VDPLWATIAEFWWIGPATIGTGTLGWLGLRRERRERRRRIELDAARHDCARDAATSARAAVVARAELDRLQAERTTGRASAAEVAAARRELDRATDEVRVAAASPLAACTRVGRSCGTAAGGDDAHLPLARVMSAHDEIIARWMTYETDPARLIAFGDDRCAPAATAAFLAADQVARQHRPATAHARVAPARFTAYRDAVAAAGRAFAVAEAEAWRRARRVTHPHAPNPEIRMPRAPVPRCASSGRSSRRA
jgi:hypothetical protein